MTIDKVAVFRAECHIMSRISCSYGAFFIVLKFVAFGNMDIVTIQIFKYVALGASSNLNATNLPHCSMFLSCLLCKGLRWS